MEGAEGTNERPQGTLEGQAREGTREPEGDEEEEGAWWAETSHTKQKVTEWPRILGAPAREGGRVRQQIDDLEERIQADRDAAGCGRTMEDRGGATRGVTTPGGAETSQAAGFGTTRVLATGHARGPERTHPVPTAGQGNTGRAAAEEQGDDDPAPAAD